MGKVIALVGASGGLGCTTLAVAMAVRAAAAGCSSVLVDADAWSGGLDIVLGLEQQAGLRWPELATRVRGRVDGIALAGTLPGSDGVRVLSHARAAGDEAGLWHQPEVLGEVIRALGQSHDLVVVDMARDDAVLRSVVPHASEVVLTCGGGVSSLAAASVAVERILALGSRPVLVTRDSGAPGDGVDLLADHLAVSVVGTIRHDRARAREESLGVAPGVRGRGPAADAADTVLLHARVGPALASRSARHEPAASRRWRRPA